MIVEHSFVTTVDGAQVYERAFALLAGAGFVLEDSAPDESVAGKFELEMNRGKGWHLDPVLCRQSVRLVFDRGRVTVAASIFPGRRGWFGIPLSASAITEPGPDSESGRPYAQMMIRLLESLENAIAGEAIGAGLSGQLSGQWAELPEGNGQSGWNIPTVALVAGGFVLSLLVVLSFCLTYAAMNANGVPVRAADDDNQQNVQVMVQPERPMFLPFYGQAGAQRGIPFGAGAGPRGFQAFPMRR
jgi:hypothetical protein